MESRKTRRSSILKPPKPRNPLSELEAPNDNTATRLTRRVSFASSNFVKEFAADHEQNTIWNVTYEEILNKSDSTRSSENAQSTHSCQQTQQLVQTTQASICSNNVKNKSKQVEIHDLVTNQPQQSTTNVIFKPVVNNIENVSRAFFPEDQVAITTNCQNKTVMENCDMDLTKIAPNNLFEFNKTFLNNSTMEFTDFNFIPVLNSTTIQQDQKLKLPDEVAVLKNYELKDVNLTETSMDITDIPLVDNRIIETKTVVPLINIRNPTVIEDVQAKKKCLGKKDNSNITKVFDESMDVTQNVAYNLDIGQNIQRKRSVGNIFNKTAILDESMEFTQKVPTLLSYKNIVDERNDVKLKLFNESTEFTEPISLKQYNFENLGKGQNQQSDKAENVALLRNKLEIAPSQLLHQKDNKAEVNQTNLFNESMEFTHQVPTNFVEHMEIPDEVSVNPERFQKTFKQDAGKTVNVTRNCDKSMEFTQKMALEFPSKIMENQKQAINENSSTLLKSIDIPNKVPLNPESLIVQHQQRGAIQQNRNCTNTWSESAQLTPIQMVQQEDNKKEGNRTNLFNESMEFTHQVPPNFVKDMEIPDGLSVNPESFQRTLKQDASKTVNVTRNSNKSMEFTQKMALEFPSKIMENQKQGINENPSMLLEKIEISNKILLNPESLLVQHQQKGVIQQNFNCTNTWSESTQLPPIQMLEQENKKEEGNQTNLFNESMEFIHKVPPNFVKDMEIPDGVSVNPESFQRTLKQDASKIVNVTRNSNKSMEFTQKMALEFPLKRMENQKQAINENPSTLFESIDIPNKVPLNPEILLLQYEEKGTIQQNLNTANATRNTNKNMEFPQKVTQLERSKIMGNQSVQKQKINENLSELFESIEIQNAVSLNPESFSVTYQQKGTIKQNPSSTKTLSDSTQFLKEISRNTEAFNSLQYLQMSQIKDSNVSCPKMLDDSIGVVQEASLSSGKLNQKQEETVENIDNSKKNERTYLVENEEKSLKRKSLENIDLIQTKKPFLGDSYSAIRLPEKQQNLGLSLNVPNNFTCVKSEDILTEKLQVENQERSLKRKSEDNFDVSPSNKPFRSDSFAAKIKYESEKLLDDTIPLWSGLESLESSDCSALPIKKAIIPLFKPEIPFRPKLIELEAYLEKASVEMENNNKAIKDLNEELLSEMTLPSHAINFNIERIDFDALQNCSFESDLTSDESSTDGSLFRLNSVSNENDKNLLTISEKIHQKHSRCKEYCSIISAENSKCILDTLFGSIRLEVHYNDETGEVNKIEICDRLSDKSESCALLAHKVLRDTLSLKNIRAAVGEHYDILTLMDYIYMNMQKIMDFLSDLDTFEGRFGLKMDSNFSVKFNIVSLPLPILWWITVDLSDMENISENSITAVAEVGSLDENKIKMFVNNCPRGITFLSAFINNILSHIELLKTQRRKN